MGIFKFFQEVVKRIVKVHFKEKLSAIAIFIFILSIGSFILAIFSDLGGILEKYPFLKSHLNLYYLFVGVLALVSIGLDIFYHAFKIYQEKDEELEDLKSQTQKYQELQRKEEKLYKYLDYTKQVAVYKSRHGIIKMKSEIEVLDDNFEVISGSLSLGKGAHEKLTFQDFEELKRSFQEDPANQFKTQTVFADLISIDNEPVISKNQIKIEKSFVNGTDKQKRNDYILKFPDVVEVNPQKPHKRRIHKGSRLKFIFGWSSPNLFPTRKEEVKSCVGRPAKVDDEEMDAESTQTITTDLNQLKLEVSFQQGIELKNIVLCRKRKGEKEEKKIGELKPNKNFHYTKYTIRTTHIVGSKYFIKWNYLN